MKKVLTLTAAMLALGSTLAMAAGGINFLVNECAAGAGSSSITWACTASTGNALQAVGSCILPANVTGFVSASIEVLVSGPGGPVPAWYTGACRASGFVQFFDPGGYPIASSCPDIWSFQKPLANPPIGLSNVYDAGSTTLQSGMIVPVGETVLAGVGAIAGADAQNLVADGTTELAVFETRINRLKTTGTGLCAGCTTQAQLALTNIWLLSAGPTTICRPGAGNSPCIGVQGAAGGLSCTGIVPTLNKTWGAVKALYR